jgi:hypothetical protein
MDGGQRLYITDSIFMYTGRFLYRPLRLLTLQGQPYGTAVKWVS